MQFEGVISMSNIHQWVIENGNEANRIYQKILVLTESLGCHDIHVKTKEPFTVPQLQSVLKALEIIQQD